MAEAANAALQGILEDSQAANQQTIAQTNTCCKTYTYEYNRFCKWIDSQPNLGPDAQGSCLTRENVDHYFTRVIATRRGNKNSLGKAVWGLEWYAKNRDHIGATPKFIVRSPAVEQAILSQHAFNEQSGGTAKPGSDPHKGLKDILPESSRLRFMQHIYRERNDWGPAAVNFTWGHNGAIRGASCNKIGYCDLNHSDGFGPKLGEPAVGLVCRSGKVHKDRSETDKQVFVWRHKEYLLCSVFATAAYVIHQITENPDIDFLHADKNERAPWWDTPLIDWSNYNGEFQRIANCVNYCYVFTTDLPEYYRGVCFHQGDIQSHWDYELQGHPSPYRGPTDGWFLWLAA